jgi:O-antigen/teichoic acid export membrane protein
MLRRLVPRLEGRARDTVWGLLDQGTSLVSSMLSFLLLGRTLGATGYGAFIGLYSLIGPFSALGQMGGFLAPMEHIAREREDPVDVTRSCLSTTTLNALLWVPIVSVVGLRWIDGLPAIAAVLFVATEFFLNGVLTTCLGIMQAVVGFVAAARLRIGAALLKTVLLVGLAMAGSLTLTSLAIGQVATIGIIVALALARVSAGIGAPARPGRIQRRHVRSVLLYGIGVGASNVQSEGDKFVLNAAHHQADAGRYGAASRLVQIALLPLAALAGANHLSFLNAAHNGTSQRRLALRMSLLAVAYAVPAVLCIVLGAPLVPRILTKEFSETTHILQLLAPVVILRGIWIFPMNGLMGLGRNMLRTAIQGGNALFSIVLCLVLIPRYSWRGALTATLVAEASLCLVAWGALLLCERGRGAAPASPREPAVSAAAEGGAGMPVVLAAPSAGGPQSSQF